MVTMHLDGIHHITAITADAPGNIDFYSRILGLRLVKKTVNQDDPTVYHLFYGDEEASPGADLTFFEYRDLPLGQAGDGMVHRIVWRVAGPDALAFWEQRLAAEGVATERAADGSLEFADFEGLGHALVWEDDGNAPLPALGPGIPPEFALLGFAGVRVFNSRPDVSAGFLADVLGFEAGEPGAWTARGDTRSGKYIYEAATTGRAWRGAGTVHHIAWTSPDEQHELWQQRLAAAGARPTTIIDRYYFRSIYFFEPSGVLFEIATPSPGFAVDEPIEHLGERLSLPPRFEPLRAQIEPLLTPLPPVRGQ